MCGKSVEREASFLKRQKTSGLHHWRWMGAARPEALENQVVSQMIKRSPDRRDENIGLYVHWRGPGKHILYYWEGGGEKGIARSA